MSLIKIKSPSDIAVMKQGGWILGQVKSLVKNHIKAGISAYELDKVAEEYILKNGAQPSFKMVEGYRWTTCINVNNGIVHGIPEKNLILKNGDIVSVDAGVYFKGFHTDSSFSIEVGKKEKHKQFLDAGEKALEKAIKSAIAGNYIYDLSEAIEKELIKNKLNPVIGLVGHGVGRNLHEDPPIPCYPEGKRTSTPLIKEGYVFAIEVMYTKGSGKIKIENDGWTISTEDDKISALFEDTVAVTKDGPLVLTDFQIQS